MSGYLNLSSPSGVFMTRLLLFFCFSFSLIHADDHKPIRVYVNVVGDLFHAGHVQFFQKAKAYGDILIVGIHSDEVTAGYKRQPILTLDERRMVIAACCYVDEVIVDSPLIITREWIEQHNIDLVIHGDDFNTDKIMEFYGDIIAMGIFKTVPYTAGISTTDIIQRIKNRG